MTHRQIKSGHISSSTKGVRLPDTVLEQHKITADTTESVSKLRSQYDDSVKPDNHSDYISNKINKMDKKEFSQTFNTIFERRCRPNPTPR
jgi:hypothetical protein